MRYLKSVLCLSLLLAALPAGAGGRKSISVPSWSDFDGERWGDLTLEGTTRSAFEREYSHRRADQRGVLEADTPSRTKTQLFLVFDGPGPEAELAWIVCFYNSTAGAPGTAEFEGRYGAHEIAGYPSTRRAGWRLLAGSEQGAAAVAQRERRGERVIGLILGTPERVTALVSRRGPARGGEVAAETRARDTLRAQIGQIGVDVYVAPNARVDQDRLQQELQRSAEERVRRGTALEVARGGDGTLAATLNVEPREPGDKRHLSLTARVTLDADGVGGAIHARSAEERSSVEADSSDRRITEEARRLVERGIDTVSRTAEDQLRKQQGQSLDDARRQARAAVLDFLAGAAQQHGG